MHELLVIVPTRGRRANVERFLGAVEATRTMADVLLVTDDDDPAYEGLLLPPWARIAQGGRAVISVKVNRHATREADRYRALMFSGDDHVPETPGWDGLLAAPARGGMSYPDCCHRDDIPEAVVMDSRLVRALDWFYPPFVSHFYADNTWADLGNRTGCLAYAREVIWRHLHHALHPGVVEYDDTYKISEPLGAPDREAWETWRAGQMADDLAKVQAARCQLLSGATITPGCGRSPTSGITCRSCTRRRGTARTP